jgi:hypothetical protein
VFNLGASNDIEGIQLHFHDEACCTPCCGYLGFNLMILYTVYALKSEYTTIRVKRSTKMLLDKALIYVENVLRRRVDYEEA